MAQSTENEEEPKGRKELRQPVRERQPQPAGASVTESGGSEQIRNATHEEANEARHSARGYGGTRNAKTVEHCWRPDVQVQMGERRHAKSGTEGDGGEEGVEPVQPPAPGQPC